MDDAKRRATIRLQATKNKETSANPKRTASNIPSVKRKQPSKGDRALKKPKVPLDPVLGLMAGSAKTVTPSKYGAGKGLMTSPSGSQKKPPVLIREDSKYALERLSSIITAEDYEDLSNHLTEAMEETGLFSIAQAMVVMKGLMGRCLGHETALDRVRDKARLTEDELIALKAWRVTYEKKLKLAEDARDEYQKLAEGMKKAFEDKEEVCQAKEVAIREYHDSDALLSELGVSYNYGFDDALYQVKALYSNLDVSTITVNIPE